MASILDEVHKHIPKNAEISDSVFEGANIVLYTKNKDFFFNSNGVIKEIVDSIKKRVELRPDSSLTLDMEEAEEKIRKIIPEEAKVSNIIFDSQRSIVIIEAEKPGLAIGKQGDVLREIRKETLWVPLVRRTPAIRSELIENIRQVLYEHSDFRRKFLHSVGKRIYDGWKRGKKEEWVRISVLGAGRQVGRSCFLLQTQESRVLLDCGINPSRQLDDPEAFPYLDAPEFNINDLDAVVLSHSHMDHCLPPETPVLMKGGIIKQIKDVKVGDKLVGFDWKNNKKTIGKCTYKENSYNHKKIYKIKTPYFTIESSPNHKFFVVDNLEIKEVEASELKKGMIIPAFLNQEDTLNKVELSPISSYDERVELPSSAVKELKYIRKNKKWSQSFVVNRLNKSRNYIYALENQYKHVYLRSLKEILKLYNLSEKEFFKKHNISKTEYPDNLSSDLSQITGYFAGDSHISGENSIRATDKSIPCLQEYKVLVKNTFNHESIVRHHPDKTKDAFILEVNNAGVLRFLKNNLNDIFNPSNAKRIPDKPILSSNENIRAFIRGLADAEGSVSKNEITIASSNHKLLDQLQLLLSNLSIPCSLDYKYNKINISSNYSIKKFAELIGFSHPDKKNNLKRLLRKITDKNERLSEVIPVTRDDLTKILIDSDIKGRIHKSPRIKDLSMAVLSWYNTNTYPERKTVYNLVRILTGRVKELKVLKKSKSIREKRIALSITRENLAKESKLTSGIITNRELNLVKDNKNLIILEKLNEILDFKISKTKDNIAKLRRLIESPVLWQRIKSIDYSDNKYDYLVDIEVSPNKNFIANGVVVHNSSVIPYLYKMGYKGPVYCTEPTRDMAALLCLDMVGIASKEGQEPIYTSTDVKDFVKHTITLDYEEVADITPDIRITLYNAGHHLGSSVVHLHIGNGLHNLLYTGDFNYETSNLLASTNTKFPRLETVIMEGTYGNKDDMQPTRREAEEKLFGIINETVKNKGKILFPVLGVGRSQEIMVILEKAMRQNLIPKIPIYLQGMLWDVTAIHTAYPDFFNARVKMNIFHKDNNPFLSEIFKRIGSRKEQQAVIDSGDSSIIMATSGMLVGGASVEFFKQLAENPKHNMILTSYQGEGTLGRRLLNGEKEINFGTNERTDMVYVKMGIHKADGISEHSSRKQLMGFVKHLDPKPRKIMVIHGEASRCIDLASSIHHAFRIETIAPRNLETIRLR